MIIRTLPSNEEGPHNTVNYLKMHDIKMHKSNYAYRLDGNQLGEQGIQLDMHIT